MTKFQSINILCLLLISTALHASRPAEDGSGTSYSQPTSENQSSIPVPTSNNLNTIPVAPEVTTPIEETQQSGDIVNLEAESGRPQVILLDFPRRGMDMSKVMNELGEPVIRHPAIGNPPITRWDYPDRIVYFEYSHVIHVVAK